MGPAFAIVIALVSAGSPSVNFRRYMAQAEQLRSDKARLQTEWRAAISLYDEVLAGYHKAANPGTELRALATAAAREIVLTLLEVGETEEARKRAAYALSHFPQFEVGKGVAPRLIDFVSQQRRFMASRQDKTPFRIVSDVDAVLWADENRLGPIQGNTPETFELLGGKYRLSREFDGKRAFAARIDLAECPRVPQAYCSWELGTRPDSPRPPRKPTVSAPTATPDLMLEVPAAPLDKRAHWAWMFVPAGGAQFAQRRPVSGTIHATVQGGLLAWFVVSQVKHSQAVARRFAALLVARGMSRGQRDVATLRLRKMHPPNSETPLRS